ncbi:MAG: fused MFS/spermidine synthase, partial [Acidobacteriota bacterium]
SSIPFHLSTVEFFHAVRAHLAPGGVFGMNMIGDLASPLQRSVLRSLAATFSHVYIFRVPGGNHLFLATDSDSRRQLADLEGVARRLAADSSPEPSWSEIARLLRPVDLDVGDALLLTDEFAPVNNLLHQGTEQLEESAKLP